MNTASLELCKELYELSNARWLGDNLCWVKIDKTGEYEVRPTNDITNQMQRTQICPAYPLDYLLRKLPTSYSLVIDQRPKGRCYWFYEIGAELFEEVAGIYDTPEDAACKLAIELLKQGTLK